jgi:hypothetical protein
MWLKKINWIQTVIVIEDMREENYMKDREKIAKSSSSLSVVILNVSGLYSWIKDTGWKNVLTKKLQLYPIKTLNLGLKINKLKVKKWKICSIQIIVKSK